MLQSRQEDADCEEAALRREVRHDGDERVVTVECTAARTAWVKLHLVVKMMMERHVSEKDAAAAASTSGRAVSERTAVSERMSPRGRP